jgi:hypothetical protein
VLLVQNDEDGILHDVGWLVDFLTPAPMKSKLAAR